VKNLFARNERVVCYFATEFGPMAVILVGAFFVASIETVWAGIVSPPTCHAVRHEQYTGAQQRQFARGEEIGRFQFGSTVIVLLPKQVAEWQAQLQAGDFVYMGQAIGKIKNQS
jgi:phosphatidylserine decarboxylase